MPFANDIIYQIHKKLCFMWTGARTTLLSFLYFLLSCCWLRVFSLLSQRHSSHSYLSTLVKAHSYNSTCCPVCRHCTCSGSMPRWVQLVSPWGHTTSLGMFQTPSKNSLLPLQPCTGFPNNCLPGLSINYCHCLAYRNTAFVTTFQTWMHLWEFFSYHTCNSHFLKFWRT